MSGFNFQITNKSATCSARVGRVNTPHGSFDTPAFMPVGTKASVKGLLPDLVAQTGSQIILNNTYHLMLQPGSELIASLGGVHKFMGWSGPILTDSGGFQVFSLGDVRQIDDDGVTFRSHIDGAEVRLTPQRSMEVQNQLGSDIIMAFDDCPPASQAQLTVGKATAGRHAINQDQYDKRNRQAVDRTLAWLARCVEAHQNNDHQALFGIVQGGTDLELRSYCAQQAVGHDLQGYAIGGCAVGEGHDQMLKVVNHTAGLLPEEKPRYLMGVGYERDILAAVRGGVDMFDCVLPTRNGRNGNAFTKNGQIRLKNAQYASDSRPIASDCPCPACRKFSRAYIRYLFQANEMLGPILISLHNICHFQSLMLDIRAAISDDAWSLLAARWPILTNNEGSNDV